MEASTNGRLSLEAFEKRVGWDAALLGDTGPENPETRHRAEALLLKGTLDAFGHNYRRLPTELDRQLAKATAIAALKARGFDAPWFLLNGAIQDAASAPIADPEVRVLEWRTLDELAQYEPPEPIIEDVLQSQTHTVVYGPSGAYKTFYAIDQSLTIATPGMSWHGQQVKHGPVCYIAGEGQGWISRRFEAWKEYHQKTPTDFHVLTRPVHFMRDDEVASLATT